MKYEVKFREKGYGGKAYVVLYDKDGKKIEPKEIIRAKSGRRGIEVYELNDGIYYIEEVSISSSGKSQVSVKEVQVQGNELKVVNEKMVRDDYSGIYRDYPDWFPKVKKE